MNLVRMDLALIKPRPETLLVTANVYCGNIFVVHLLVDTGFLVALYIRADPLHHAALDFLKRNRSPLLTVAPVIVETCFFLDAKGKTALLGWVTNGGLAVVDIPVKSYPLLADYTSYRHDLPFFSCIALGVAPNPIQSLKCCPFTISQSEVA